MRGMSAELMAMVAIGVVIAAFLFFMMFGRGVVKANVTKPPGSTCDSGTECVSDSNPAGKLCLRMNSGQYHCGCLITTDCPSGSCNTITNRCG